MLSVGRGGDLYWATHVETGEPFAVRRLAEEVLDDHEMADTVLGDFERLRAVSHPNILTIHEIIHDVDGPVFVVMDHLHGVSLDVVLKRTRETEALAPPLATHIALQICHALDHAHHLSAGGGVEPLVHGALWPPNVLLGAGGEVQVTDFGAWVIPAAMQREGGGSSIRTQFSYRSPEHVNGDELTPATDIFCVGILLYEMLMGRTLFLGASLLETLELVEGALLGSMEGAPPQLRAVLERCLSQDPGARYTDASGLISALSVAMPGAGTREVRQGLVRYLEPLLPPPPALAGAAPAPAPALEPQPAAKPAPQVAAKPAPGPPTARETIEEKLPLAPEPLDDGVAEPLRPLPGLDPRDDEPTHINPEEVNEALAALSKDATDPAVLDELVDTDAEDEEPTRIDPIIPGITGPLPFPGEADDAVGYGDGPTHIMPPEEAKVLWDSVETVIPGAEMMTERSQDDETEPDGSLGLGSFKPDDATVEQDTQPNSKNPALAEPMEEIETKKSTYPKPPRDPDEVTAEELDDEEPTAPVTPDHVEQKLKLLKPVSPDTVTATKPSPAPRPDSPGPDFGARAEDSVTQEEPTAPTQPETPSKPPAETDGLGDDDEPTVQARPRPNASTLAGLGGDARAPSPAEAARQLALPPRQPVPPPPAAAARPVKPALDTIEPEAATAPRPLVPAAIPPVKPAPAPVASPPRGPAPAVGPFGGPPGPPAGHGARAPENDPHNLGLAATLSLEQAQAQHALGPPTAQPAAPYGAPPGVEGGDDNAPLTFSPSEESVASFGQDQSSGFSTFDRDDDVLSVSFDAPTRRFTAAHLLLLVAIIVFMVAVGLLLRRLLSARSSKRATVEQITDAGAASATRQDSQPLPPTSPLEPKRRRRQRPGTSPGKGPGKGAGKGAVKASGKHLTELLQQRPGQPGVIKVVSTPPGLVFLDRRSKGATPVLSKGRPGEKMSVVVVAKDHQIYRKAVTLPLSRALHLSVQLEQGHYPRARGRHKGWLSIRCTRRSRWRILLDGKDSGFNCPVTLALKPRRYKLTFTTLFGDKERHRRVRVRRGRRTKIWAPRR